MQHCISRVLWFLFKIIQHWTFCCSHANFPLLESRILLVFRRRRVGIWHMTCTSNVIICYLYAPYVVPHVLGRVYVFRIWWIHVKVITFVLYIWWPWFGVMREPHPTWAILVKALHILLFLFHSWVEGFWHHTYKFRMITCSWSLMINIDFSYSHNSLDVKHSLISHSF